MAFSKAVLNMASSKTPGLHTCFGLNLNRGLNKTNVFCVQNIFYTKSCFTQKLCSPQTLCFTQKQKPCSCWACARAVCSLQDSSSHGGRRNTPKAVEYTWDMTPEYIRIPYRIGVLSGSGPCRCGAVCGWRRAVLCFDPCCLTTSEVVEVVGDRLWETAFNFHGAPRSYMIILNHTRSNGCEWLHKSHNKHVRASNHRSFFGFRHFCCWPQSFQISHATLVGHLCDGNWSWLEAQTVEQRSPRAGEQRRLLAQWPCRDQLRSAEIRALSNLQIIEGINEIRFLCGLPFPAGWVWSPMTLTSSKLCMILLLRSASFTSFSPEVPVYLATPLRKVWYICEPWRSVPEARTTWAWWHDDDMMIVDDRVHHGAEPATSHRSPSRAPATTKIIKRSQSSKCWEVQMAKMIWNGLKRHM